MATTGVRKRHHGRCPTRTGGRCRCAGTWEAWVYLPRDGRKVYRSFATESEAKAWRADATRAKNRGRLRTATSETVREAGEGWLAGAEAGTIRDRSGRAYKPSTLRGYRESLRLRIFPAFGAVRLSDLRRPDVQAFVDRLLGEGRSPGTIRNTLNPLQAIYRHAIRRDLVSVNPTEHLDLPTSRGRRDRIATPAEARALIDALPAADRAVWATAFYAGLRRGELRALRWSDVDLGGSKIRVERSWDQYEGAIDPKSEASARTLPISTVLRDYLDAHKLASGREGEDLVFGRTPSEAFVASTVRSRALRAWTSAGVAPITLHECRHTFASLLIASGANAKAIQTYLGHATIQMTFDRYGHLMPGSRDESRELMDRYLEAALAEADAERALSGEECPT